MQPLHLLRRGRAACHWLIVDVPSQHLMCPIPSADRRRQGHPVGGAPAGSAGKQCARAERCAIPVFSSTRSFPCTLRIRRSRASGHKKIVSTTDIRGSKHYILYVPGPTCRGPVPLCMPPSAIKGEASDITHTISGHTIDSQAHKQYISQWSRVLRSGGPNHSKSLCVLEFFPFIPTIKQNA
jgi:hypothetical protein